MPSDRAIEKISELVAFDTTSHLSNLALIDFVRDYLASLGIDCQIIRNETGDKANLYATVGPSHVPGIILSGHTDVVPARAEEWASDPFILSERDGRFFGRGSADMKGFIGLVLAMLPEFLKRDLRIPLHLALSHDEEVGCLGVHGLLDVLQTLPVRPAMCIIGEPTGMQVAIGHKGTRCYRATFTGLEAHSSLAPRGVNAIEYAARLVEFLRLMRERFAVEGPFDEAFDITYCTVHSGVIHGGKAVNIVPSTCSLDFEFRHLAEQNPDAIFAEIEAFARDQLEPAMHAISQGTGIRFDTVYAYPGLNTGTDADIVTFVKALAGRNDQIKIAFGTEGGLFDQRLGIPTVVCGPGHIAQAHQPDEYIAGEQLDAGEAFLRRLLDEMSKG